MTSRIGAWIGDRADRAWNWYHSNPFRYAERVAAPLAVAAGSLYGLEQGINYINDHVQGDTNRAIAAVGAVAGTAALNFLFNTKILSGLYNVTLRPLGNLIKNGIFRRHHTPDIARRDWRSLRECLNDYNDNQAFINPDCNGRGNSIFRYGKTLVGAALIATAIGGTYLKNDFSVVNTGRNIVAGLEEAIHSPLEGYAASEDLQELIDSNGLDEEDVEYLTRVIHYECAGCTPREKGAIMRVAYNRATDKKQRFSGTTIKDVVSTCVKGKNNWNCGDGGFTRTMADSRNGISNPQNAKLAVSAVDFLTGRGDEARGAHAAGCRHSFARLDIIPGSEKWDLSNPLKIGYHTFHGPLFGCADYPPAIKEPRVKEETEKPKQILLVGDSNTGNGNALAPAGKALAAKLKEKYPSAEVRFVAKDGATAATFLENTDVGRTYKDAVGKADIVVYSLGTNYGYGESVTASYIDQLIDYRDSDSTCYWIGAPYEERRDIDAQGVNSRLEGLVTKEGCTFIDPIPFNGKGDLAKDKYKVHLNPTGADKFAAGVVGKMQ